MKVAIAILLVLSALLLSCDSKNNTVVLTYKLKRADYVDKLTVSGTVQAVINYPVVPPGGYFGVTTVVKLAADGDHVMQGDTICVLSNRELETMYKDELRRSDSLDAALKRTEADCKLNIAMSEAQLSTSEAQLKISSLDSLKIKYATRVEQELFELQIKKAGIEKEKTEKKLAAVRSIGDKDISQIKSRITEEKARVATLADQVKSLIIIARHDGIVQRTESPRFSFVSSNGSGSIGGPIREGSVLFMDNPVLKFPDLSKMQVSIEVAEADFRKIESGQRVKISVDASMKLETTGRVGRKNLIGQNEERYTETNVKFYEVIIDVDSCHTKMKPGLSATCEIELSQIKDTIFVPTLAIFERDSAKVVYVRKKKKFYPVTVKTGTSGSSFTIIEKGLKGDETVALSLPPGKMISDRTKSKTAANTLRIHDPA